MLSKDDRRPILIQGAMDVETDLWKEQLSPRARREIGPWVFYQGTLFGIRAVVSETRIGMANTAAATALGIREFAPRAIINQGVAGGYREDYRRGDIILGERVVNYSAYETAEGREIPRALQAGDAEREAFFSDPDLLEICLERWPGRRIYKGTLASGDGWNRDAGRIAAIREVFGADCEDMETAAAAQIAAGYGIPFLGARILSNNELTGEAYDRTLGRELQRYLMASLRRQGE